MPRVDMSQESMRHYYRGRVFESTGAIEGVSHVAFQNPEGGQVLVLANAGKVAARPKVALAGSSVQAELPPDSVTTLAWGSQV